MVCRVKACVHGAAAAKDGRIQPGDVMLPPRPRPRLPASGLSAPRRAPARRAGRRAPGALSRAEQVVVGVDGENCEGRSIDDVRVRIVGAQGSMVSLAFRRGGEGGVPLQCLLMRGSPEFLDAMARGEQPPVPPSAPPQPAPPSSQRASSVYVAPRPVRPAAPALLRRRPASQRQRPPVSCDAAPPSPAGRRPSPLLAALHALIRARGRRRLPRRRAPLLR